MKKVKILKWDFINLEKEEKQHEDLLNTGWKMIATSGTEGIYCYSVFQKD